MKQRALDFKKLWKTLAILAVIFIAAFAIIFGIVSDFNLLFYITDIIFILLLVNFICYFFYKTFIDTDRWIRILVLGFASVLFIILGLSFASGNLTAYLAEGLNVPPLIGTNILLSFTVIAVGGIFYYMTFNGHPLLWMEEIKEKAEEKEHRNKLLAKIVRKIKKV